ncbi:MAG: class I SAM-dependent methyltransferase [Candidatus Micrarchaeota archaeon]
MESPDTPWARSIDGRVKKKAVPSPSRAAVFFLGFLRLRGISQGRLVDIGCGNGRNAVYFAENGFEVHAVDRSDEVLKDLDLHGVMPHCHSVADYWLFEDGFFDLAMDVLCYSEQDAPGYRERYVAELKRVLKPGSYVLLSVPKGYTEARVKKEFSGFAVMSSEESEDRVFGKKLKVLNIILGKKI